MVIDPAMVPNMIAAPQRDVVTDGNKGLYGIIFQNKAVIADCEIVQHTGFRADITYEFITQGLRSEVFFFAGSVQIRISKGNEEGVLLRRIDRSDILERHNIQSAEPRAFGEIGCIHGKSFYRII